MVIRSWLFICIILLSSPCLTAQVRFGDFELPVREVRQVGISGNLGLKSLTGIGVSFQYYLIPKFALDGGVGLSNFGYNLSGRGRYLFSKKNFSPFAALGFIYGTGSFNQVIELTDVSSGNALWINVYPSRFLQLTGGAEYVARSGFFIMFNAGISILLHDTNYEITSGFPSPEMKESLDFIYNTGFSTEVSIGYIFGNKKGYRGKL
ncbi:MAG: hypothetical protein P8100_00010 [bacterium]|jgi:hypothetical protein